MIEYHLDFEAKIEFDESYFVGICKGKRGRGAGGKTIVFGILKRKDRVYTIIIKDTKQSRANTHHQKQN